MSTKTGLNKASGPYIEIIWRKKNSKWYTIFEKKEKKKIIPQYQRYSFRIFCDKIGAHNKPFLKICWFVVILLILLDWSFDELNKKKVIRLAQFLKMIFESFEYAVLDTSFRHVSLTCAQGKNLIMKKKKKKDLSILPIARAFPTASLVKRLIYTSNGRSTDEWLPHLERERERS